MSFWKGGGSGSSMFEPNNKPIPLRPRGVRVEHLDTACVDEVGTVIRVDRREEEFHFCHFTTDISPRAPMSR